MKGFGKVLSVAFLLVSIVFFARSLSNLDLKPMDVSNRRSIQERVNIASPPKASSIHVRPKAASIYARPEDWPARVKSQTGIAIQNTPEFDAQYFSSLEKSYYPSAEDFPILPDFEEAVTLASLALIKKHHDPKGISLQKEFAGFGIGISAEMETEIATRGEKIPRFSWEKIDFDPLKITFLRNAKASSYFPDSKVPSFSRSLKPGDQIAEVSLNIVSIEGEKGIIKYYFYSDGAGTYFAPNTDLSGGTVFIRGTSSKLVLTAEATP
ncbi:hypothetical protein IT570_11060 [Candidatus Sumerlaeota bacterium]|nr:hypothetical protein [Candidatus Sumerlaeota bacterium]